MKRRIVLYACLLLLLLAAGCAAPSSDSAPSYEFNTQEVAAEDDPEDAKGWSGEEASPDLEKANEDFGGHKVIKTASLGLETRAFDKDLSAIKQKAADMGGYVASSNINGKKPEKYGDAGRSASLTLRIPQEKMEGFLASARGVASVTYENTGSEDITASYFDTQSRLEIYRTQRDRTLALLEEADNMEDIITLETELSRLTYEIESLTTQLEKWDDLVDFATIEISMEEIPSASAASSNDASVWTRIGDGFMRTLGGMQVFFEGLFVFLVAASPVLLLLAAIVVVVLLLVRRSARRRRKRPAQSPCGDAPHMQSNPGMAAPPPPVEGNAAKEPDSKK